MLPNEKTKPRQNLWQHPILLYGVPKIGKSCLLSEIEDNLFFNTGGGLDALEVYQIPIPTWQDFLAAGKEFLEGKHKFKVCTIDTIDRLHKLAITHIMAEQKIKHPADLDFGKAYDMIKDEMMRPLTKLALSQYGLIFVSHAKEIQVKTRIKERTKIITTLQDHIWQLIDSLTGVIMFYTTQTGEDGTPERVIHVTPNENWLAGDRTGKLARHGAIKILDGEKNWERIEKIFTEEQSNKVVNVRDKVKNHLTVTNIGENNE